jgi:hypothetical protein
MSMPMVHTWTIDTAPAHLRGFAHQHVLEFNAEQIEQRGDELWHVGMTGIETYELENKTVFGRRPVVVDVTSIKRLLAHCAVPFQMIRLELTQQWVDYIMQSCGCEEAGIERHTMESCLRPGILVQWTMGPDSTYTSTIDGSHRLVKSWRLGLKHFEMAMVQSGYIIDHVVKRGHEETLFHRHLDLKRRLKL